MKRKTLNVDPLKQRYGHEQLDVFKISTIQIQPGDPVSFVSRFTFYVLRA